MSFKKMGNFNSLLEYSYLSKNSGGYISANKDLFNSIELNLLNKKILNKAVFGTPIFKFGNSGNKIILISGVHGDELSSQSASLKIIDYLLRHKINDTIYIIPFLAPKSSMENLRTFFGRDLNRTTYVKESLSNYLLKFILDNEIQAVADFHTTAIGSNPGYESIFCSKKPSFESYKIAKHIAYETDSKILDFNVAGEPYKGALEDECNLRGVPAITCEVVSPFGSIGEGSIERSFMQMKSFLSYFNI